MSDLLWKRTLQQKMRALAGRLRADVRHDHKLPGVEMPSSAPGVLNQNTFINAMIGGLTPLLEEYERQVIKHFQDNPPQKHPLVVEKPQTLSSILSSMTEDEVERLLDSLGGK